jgi:hypothetical protein
MSVDDEGRVRLPTIFGRRIPLIAWLVTALVLLAAPSSLAGPPFEIAAVKTPSPPRIDGAIDEPEWERAAMAAGFVQYEPRRGEAATMRTEVLVLYDERNLYVAFRLWDTEEPTAQVTQRDQNLMEVDDAVAILLDSHGDRRTGYYFMTNLLGTQADGRIVDDGRNREHVWDGAWSSAARRTPDGWTAEFAIPFSTIRYTSSANRPWGINFYRSRRRSLEISTWAGPLNDVQRVSQAGRLTGLQLPVPARRHQVVPYGLSRLQKGQSSDWDAGIDLRYNLTPELAAYGTLYPDFATIEADQEQVNLTRFEVSLAEKRQFFMEGQEMYGQRVRTFYSRRIADITGGGKVQGRQGPWTLAFMGVESQPIGTLGRATYTVLRSQRDVLGRSNIAIMAADRRLDGSHQGSVGLDANMALTRTFGITAQLARGYGRYGRGTTAYFVRPSYDSPTAHAHIRYTHLGDRFGDNVNAIGQIRDDDRRELDAALSKTWWIQAGRLERLHYRSNYNIYWSQRGMLRSWQVDESLNAQLRNRWSAEVSLKEEFKQFEKDFRNRTLGLDLGYNTREYQSVRAGIRTGRNFDSDFWLWNAAARWKATASLSAEYELQRLTLVPDPNRSSTWIHVVRANQFFTRDLFVRMFFQTNSAIDRRNVQAVFVYRYLPPFGTVQVAYQRGTAAFGERSDQGHTLFLKITTVF